MKLPTKQNEEDFIREAIKLALFLVTLLAKSKKERPLDWVVAVAAALTYGGFHFEAYKLHSWRGLTRLLRRYSLGKKVLSWLEGK